MINNIAHVICFSTKKNPDPTDDSSISRSVTCPADAFGCDKMLCIHISYVCDFVTHCQDGADEDRCGKNITIQNLKIYLYVQ